MRIAIVILALLVSACGHPQETFVYQGCRVSQYPTSLTVSCPDGSTGILLLPTPSPSPKPTPTPTPKPKCKHGKDKR